VSPAPHPRFSGIARLYGHASLQRFLSARVAVIGVGGVGSWAVEALARSGIGHLTLVDLDEICLTNINRQLHAMDGQIGRQKTEAMAERVRAIHPEATVHIEPCFFHARTAPRILDPGFDAVIDAIDDTSNKAHLLAELHRRHIFAVTCGAAGGRRDATRIRTADLAFTGKDPLLHQVRRTLRRSHGFPAVPMGSKPLPMGIDAVFSDEPTVFLQCDGSISDARPADTPSRLTCANGMGTVSHVTAAFGMIAASRVLEHLSTPTSSPA